MTGLDPPNVCVMKSTKGMLFDKSHRPHLAWKVRGVSVQRGHRPMTDASATIDKSVFYREITGKCLLDVVEDGRCKPLVGFQDSSDPKLSSMDLAVANPEQHQRVCHPSAVLRQTPLCTMKCAMNGTEYVGNGSDDTLLMKGNRRDHVHLLAMSQRSVRNDGPSLKASRTNFAFSLRAQAPVSSDRSARALASKRILSSRVPCNRFLDAGVVAGQFPEWKLVI